MVKVYLVLALFVSVFFSRYVCGAKGLVTMEKEWSPMPIAYPHQLTVKVGFLMSSVDVHYKRFVSMRSNLSECHSCHLLVQFLHFNSYLSIFA